MVVLDNKKYYFMRRAYVNDNDELVVECDSNIKYEIPFAFLKTRLGFGGERVVFKKTDRIIRLKVFRNRERIRLWFSKTKCFYNKYENLTQKHYNLDILMHILAYAEPAIALYKYRALYKKKNSNIYHRGICEMLMRRGNLLDRVILPIKRNIKPCKICRPNEEFDSYYRKIISKRKTINKKMSDRYIINRYVWDNKKKNWILKYW